MKTTTTQPRRPAPQYHISGQWNTLKEFRDEPTGLSVRVQGRPGPQYQITMAATQEVQVNNGLVAVKNTGPIYGRLISEAQLYLQERRQGLEDEEIEAKQYREYRDLERAQGGQKVVPGLSRFTQGSKTAREVETGKANRHAQNLAARQSADQERTSRTKGKGK